MRRMLRIALVRTALLLAAGVASVIVLGACGGGTSPAATAEPTSESPSASPVTGPTVTPVSTRVVPATTVVPTTPTVEAEEAVETGRIDVLVTDPPPADVERYLVTIERLEVHRAGAGDEDG